ncbi:MAG TPA: PDZ domain-containing protein [Flavisolibacter sp.]
MKKMFFGLVIATVAAAMIPSAAFAQKEKEKEKEKSKKETETIVITRNVNANVNTVVEIKGDKILINGKEVKEGTHGDVTVHRHKFRTGTYSTAPGAWNYSMSGDLFDEDENRAMLGVVTEGHDKGAEIKSITKGGGAEKAGLKKGDIITKLGSKKIETSDDVTSAIRAQKPGEKLTVTFLRDGKEQTVTAELGKWKGIRMNAVEMPNVIAGEMAPTLRGFENGFGGVYTPFTGRPKLGLSIQDTEDGKGVKVLEVDDDSNAAKAGIRENDVILAIDDKDVKGTDDVTRTLRDSREKFTFNFKILRDGKEQTVEVKMPRKLKTADL